jgi:predicted N-acyltransferase
MLCRTRRRAGTLHGAFHRPRRRRTGRAVDLLSQRRHPLWPLLGDKRQLHSLHFELCFYQGIDYCLREGLATFEPGAGGEHKVARGFAPTVVRSCHWIADERMRQLLEQHLARQHPAVLAYAEEAASHLPFRKDG